MFVVQRAPKVYKNRREAPSDQDYVKLFRFNPESVAWLATHFLGTDSGETRGGAIDNITKMKILLRYIADPGTIGILQALEAIKIITGFGESLSRKFIVFDATDTSFRRIKLRERNPKCAICGVNPTITELIDYEQFCGSKITDKVDNISILKSSQHINIKEFTQTKTDHLVLDVRPEVEFQMCNLPGTINFPYSKIEKKENIDCLSEILSKGKEKVYLLCRRGNDSQRAVVILKEMFPELPVHFLNVDGGLNAYSKYVDSNFPLY